MITYTVEISLDTRASNYDQTAASITRDYPEVTLRRPYYGAAILTITCDQAGFHRLQTDARVSNLTILTTQE